MEDTTLQEIEANEVRNIPIEVVREVFLEWDLGGCVEDTVEEGEQRDSQELVNWLWDFNYTEDHEPYTIRLYLEQDVKEEATEGTVNNL